MKKKNIRNLENSIEELKKNSLIDKYKQEIQKLKKIINEDEDFLIMMKK